VGFLLQALLSLQEIDVAVIAGDGAENVHIGQIAEIRRRRDVGQRRQRLIIGDIIVHRAVLDQILHAVEIAEQIGHDRPGVGAPGALELLHQRDLFADGLDQLVCVIRRHPGIAGHDETALVKQEGPADAGRDFRHDVRSGLIRQLRAADVFHQCVIADVNAARLLAANRRKQRFIFIQAVRRQRAAQDSCQTFRIRLLMQADPGTDLALAAVLDGQHLVLDDFRRLLAVQLRHPQFLVENRVVVDDQLGLVRLSAHVLDLMADILHCIRIEHGENRPRGIHDDGAVVAQLRIDDLDLVVAELDVVGHGLPLRRRTDTYRTAAA